MRKNNEKQKKEVVKMFQDHSAVLQQLKKNTSELYKILRKAVNGVKLTKKDLKRVTLLTSTNASEHETLLQLDVKLSHIIGSKFDEQQEF